VLPSAERDEIHSAALHDQSLRGEEREHYVDRTRVQPEVRANRAGRAGVLREPREEIQVRDGGGEQIHRANSVAIAVKGEGIGHRFIEQMAHRFNVRARAGDDKSANELPAV
jgi:hypothetical protein